MIGGHTAIITYLRLSVTDRCDLRCAYCMPERMEFLPRSEVLSLDELDQMASAFILVNSISGLAGQASKGLGAATAVIGEHGLLFPAVLVGGLLGATLGARRIEPKWVRIMTALLILYVAARLGIEVAG